MKDNLSAYSSNDYDNRVSSVLPYYQEFHFQILDLVKVLNKDKIKWLESKVQSMIQFSDCLVA